MRPYWEGAHVVCISHDEEPHEYMRKLSVSETTAFMAGAQYGDQKQHHKVVSLSAELLLAQKRICAQRKEIARLLGHKP